LQTEQNEIAIKNRTTSINSSLRQIFKKIYNLLAKYLLIPDYALLWAPYLIPKAIKEAKNIDLIYATALPFSVLIQAVIIKKITKKKLILDIKDDWIIHTSFLQKPFLYA